MEVVKYSKSIPAPGDYVVPSTLDNKGVSLRPRLVDTSLKHLKDVNFFLKLDSRARSLFASLIN